MVVNIFLATALNMYSGKKDYIQSKTLVKYMFLLYCKVISNFCLKVIIIMNIYSPSIS